MDGQGRRLRFLSGAYRPEREAQKRERTAGRRLPSSSLFHRRAGADDPRSRFGPSQIPFSGAGPSVPPSRIWAVSFTCFPWVASRWSFPPPAIRQLQSQLTRTAPAPPNFDSTQHSPISQSTNTHSTINNTISTSLAAPRPPSPIRSSR